MNNVLKSAARVIAVQLVSLSQCCLLKNDITNGLRSRDFPLRRICPTIKRLTQEVCWKSFSRLRVIIYKKTDRLQVLLFPLNTIRLIVDTTHLEESQIGGGLHVFECERVLVGHEPLVSSKQLILCRSAASKGFTNSCVDPRPLFLGLIRPRAEVEPSVLREG